MTGNIFRTISCMNEGKTVEVIMRRYNNQGAVISTYRVFTNRMSFASRNKLDVLMSNSKRVTVCVGSNFLLVSAGYPKIAGAS